MTGCQAQGLSCSEYRSPACDWRCISYRLRGAGAPENTYGMGFEGRDVIGMINKGRGLLAKELRRGVPQADLGSLHGPAIVQPSESGRAAESVIQSLKEGRAFA
jgi:hypothetical protein